DEMLSAMHLRFLPNWRIDVFDGTHTHVLTPRITDDSPPYQTEFTIQTDDYSKMFITTFEFPIFFAHGICPLQRAVTLRNLRIPLNRDALYVHGHALHHDRDCVVVRTATRNHPCS